MKNKTVSPYLLIALVALVVGNPSSARAAATWNGNTNLNWNDSGNWSALPVPSATEALTFAGSLGLTNNNDFAANSQFNTLTFAAGAGSFVLGGNAINLGDGTAGTKLTNSSSVGQTINTNLALLQTTTIATGGTAGAGITIGGNISGTGFGITSSGAGGLILSGSNSYSGATTLATTTTLRAVANGGNTTSGISSALSPNSLLTLAPSSSANIPVLELRADDTTTFNTAGVAFTSVSSQNRTATIDVGNAGSGTNKTLTLGGAFSVTSAGASPNATTVNVTGSNGYTLALGAVTNSGTTNGILNFNATTANLTIASIVNGGSSAIYGFTGSGNTTIIGDLTRPTTSRSVTLTQSGSGSLTLLGSASSLSATGGSGYNFNLNAGTLNVNNAAALGDGASVSNVTYTRVLNLSGGTLDNTSGSDITVLNNNAASTTGVTFTTNINGDFIFGTSNTNSKGLALNVGGGTSTGKQRGYITLGGVGSTGTSRTITTNGDDYLALNGAIVNGATANALVKEGAARLLLGNANFYSGGTTVNNGTLEVNGDSAIAQSGISGTTATSTTNAANVNITGLSSSVVSNLRVGQTVTGTNIPAGTIVTGILSATSIGISQGATAVGSVSDLAFSAGGGLGTGAVTVTGGTLLVNSTGNINNTTGVSVTGGTFKYNGTTALDRNVTLNGGKFSYNSSNNYAGSLTFTSGTIGGSNISNLNLSIGTGKIMSPGNSTGTMAAGNTTWATGGTVLFELNDTTGTAGSTSLGWDLLNAATLDITAGTGEFTIQIASLDNLQAVGNALNFNGANNYTWLFVDAGATITGFNAAKFLFDETGFLNSTPGTFSISQGTGLDDDKLYLNYTGVIPEPSTYALLAGGLGLLAFLRRRSKA